jgi:predicted RNA-binding Zn-ribbon protein involved in translation (DUF1610 family)
MSTITCPSCSQVVEGVTSPLAVCPHCGDSLAPPPRTYDSRRGIDLRTVGKRQRSLLWFVLALLLFQLSIFTDTLGLPPAFELVVVLVYWALLISILVSVLRLLAALRVHVIWRIFCALLLIAPCINLLVLLVINARATRALKDAGLRVGLMGVRDDQLLRKLSVHLCRQCGYDLTGNVSGVCPECGTAITVQATNG